MERTGDVMTTWGWGLRRYAWVVVVFVVGLGVLVPLAQSRSQDVYQAQAQVGPTQKLLLPNLDPLPRFAQSVFNDGAVARDVRALLQLPREASVIPGTVQLRTAQDNPVMVITGQGSSPQDAASVANTAAAALVVELNRYSGSVGTFAMQSEAVRPAKPEPKIISGAWGVVVGLLAGLVAGCGLVGLIVAVRRPVVGTSAAQGATGLPVVGRVPLTRYGAPDEKARLAVGALSRRLLTEKHDVIYVTGPVQNQVERLGAAIRAFLANAGGTPPPHTPVYGGPDVDASPGLVIPEVTTVDATSLETWVAAPGRCSLTLLVVPEGIRASALHHLVEQHGSGGATALVLVQRRRSWAPRPKGRKVAVPAAPTG